MKSGFICNKRNSLVASSRRFSPTFEHPQGQQGVLSAFQHPHTSSGLGENHRQNIFCHPGRVKDKPAFDYIFIFFSLKVLPVLETLVVC